MRKNDADQLIKIVGSKEPIKRKDLFVHQFISQGWTHRYTTDILENLISCGFLEEKEGYVCISVGSQPTPPSKSDEKKESAAKTPNVPLEKSEADVLAQLEADVAKP